MRQTELQRADGAAAEAPVEPLDDQLPHGVDLIPPSVVLDQDVERPGGEEGGPRARGEIDADRVGPDGGGHVPIQPSGKPVPAERALQDPSDDLGPAPREEVPSVHARLRSRTSCSAGTSSSRR